MRKIAHIVSWVLSPLLIPSYGMVMALWLTGLGVLPVWVRVRIAAIVWVLTCVLPMLAIFALWCLRVVTSFGLNNRKERPIPYLLTVACYLATAGYLYAIHAPQWLWLFMVAGAGAAVVSFIVNFWWKISAHMAAAAGLLAMAFRIASDKLSVIDMWPVMTVAILLLGLLGTCRMVLKCHTLGQVLAGTANGFLWVYLLTI
ncbi:hypothetical protein [uncultured Muribaculum sp.]|uniref:hypothetical protein n=1 Tax=uncultured Muribaculum sp. TaxID=1918613 RepID=UPI0025B0AC71|nr:hypothetical protein [uncultured Muribaculum sp.]